MAYDKIILSGKQTCDYLYIQSKAPAEDEFSCVNDEPSVWNNSTSLYANFSNEDNRLGAGDSSVVGTIDGYEVYRRKYNESHSEYIGTIQPSKNGVGDLIVDYSVKNGVDYTYYLYPNVDSSKGGIPLSPLVTKQVAIDAPYWSLFVVDETDEENIFYLDKMFKFELNIQVDDMTNNTQVSIAQNFTKYPTIQYGMSNYWSGSLSALSGFIASNCIDYVQTTNMIDELKSLYSDTRRKFLKDIDGNLWEVNISAPLNINTQYTATQSLKTWKFSWVEVGDATGISIINDPTKPVTDWVLTESGHAVPYFTYQWDEQSRWDDSYRWTESNDFNILKNTNLGRDIVEQGGD